MAIKELNTEARDSLVYQITEAMDDLNQKKHDLETALNYMEQARSSSYTEPMDEVKIILDITSKRLEFDLAIHKSKALNLAGVAAEIHKGEIGDNHKM